MMQTGLWSNAGSESSSWVITAEIITLPHCVSCRNYLINKLCVRFWHIAFIMQFAIASISDRKSLKLISYLLVKQQRNHQICWKTMTKVRRSRFFIDKHIFSLKTHILIVNHANLIVSRSTLHKSLIFSTGCSPSTNNMSKCRENLEKNRWKRDGGGEGRETTKKIKLQYFSSPVSPMIMYLNR